MKEEIAKKLKQRVIYGKVLVDEPLKVHTSFKVGGNADLFVIPNDVDELIHSVLLCKEEDVPFYILGNGSNVIVRDGGFKGVIINIGNDLSEIVVHGDILLAEAGALLKDVAVSAADNYLSGLEFASGIPGSIGGAVFMNAGAYDGEIKDIIVSVEALDIEKGRVITIPKDDMQLGYRSSIFQEANHVILSVKLKLHTGEENEIRAKMKEFNEKRNTKQPVNMPCAGSIFKRPEGHFAGQLISESGLSGTSLGGAEVSELHSGFIVNTGDATASDVINLIEIVKTVVLAQQGVALEPEVRIIGEEIEV